MRGHIRRTGKDKRPLDANGKPIGRDTRSYSVVLDVGRDENGKRQQKWKSFKTEKAAETWLAEQMQSVNRGTYVEPTKQTVREFMADWLTRVKPSLKATTAASYPYIIDHYIVPDIGGIRVRDLTSERIGKLYGDLSGRGYSSRTVRYAHMLLKAALSAAVREGKLGRNPTDGLKPPRHQAKFQKVPWTPEQLGQFMSGAESDRMYAAYVLAATTGLRRGEVCGLHWSDINFKTGTLSVKSNRVMVQGKPVETTPKGNRGRTISLDAATVETLQAHRVRQLAEVIDDTAPSMVFTSWEGQPLNPDSLSYFFDQAVKTSGLPRLTLHGLRHTWATIALQSGVHPKVVQERLGHSSIAVTMDIYSHVLQEMDSSAAETVASLFMKRSQEASKPLV